MTEGKARSRLIKAGKIGFWLFFLKGVIWLVIALIGALLGSQGSLFCK
jgi:hypothetical protein